MDMECEDPNLQILLPVWMNSEVLERKKKRQMKGILRLSQSVQIQARPAAYLSEGKAVAANLVFSQ